MIYDYVIPDVMIICDRKNILKGTYSGIPRFVVETLSPSTALKDRTIKKDIYQSKGVDEYWIVDIRSCSLEIYHLQNDNYILINNFMLENDETDPGYNAETEFSLKAFPNVKFQLKEIFENI